jgi:hypothetical protein
MTANRINRDGDILVPMVGGVKPFGEYYSECDRACFCHHTVRRLFGLCSSRLPLPAQNG